MPPTEIRQYNGEIDEVIAHGVDVHLEYMDDGNVWLGITHADGTVDHLTLFTRRGAKILSRFDRNC